MERSNGGTHQIQAVCVNCQTKLQGPYCYHCGQKEVELNLTLKYMLSTFFGDLFSFDSRVWRSLKPLICRPGFLTTEYIQGRRAPFIPPFRLFLLVGLAYFFVQAVYVSLDLDLKTSKIQSEFSDKMLEISEGAGEQRTKKQREMVDGTVDREQVAQKFRDAARRLKEPEVRRHVKQNVSRQMNQAMFFLMPLFALFLHALYRKRERYYANHLVFSLYFHALAFLIFTINRVLQFLPLPETVSNLLSLFTNLYILYYLYRSMREVYGQSRWKTSLKFMALFLVYFFIFSVVFMVFVFRLLGLSFTN